MRPFALYLDPSKADFMWQPWPDTPPEIGYYRLTDLSIEALSALNLDAYPRPHYSIAEIHPAQWETVLNQFPNQFNRLSIALEKSRFADLNHLRSRLSDFEVDIMFEWDHRFALAYYTKLISYWIYCGVSHFSFYNLTDFAVWQRLQQQLRQDGFVFYDRYHAAKPYHESRYQKHLARFGNLLALGGWSRWTDEDGYSKTRGPQEPDWTPLSATDTLVERRLFAMADRDGLALTALQSAKLDVALKAHLISQDSTHIHPTDQGLWDTVRLVSALDG